MSTERKRMADRSRSGFLTPAAESGFIGKFHLHASLTVRLEVPPRLFADVAGAMPDHVVAVTSAG